VLLHRPDGRTRGEVPAELFIATSLPPHERITRAAVALGAAPLSLPAAGAAWDTV